MEEKNYLSQKNKISFAVSGFGQNLVIGFVSTYILIFFSDVLIIAPAIVSVLMLVARVFDALNDPIMGTVVDKTRTKWGKARPYLMIAPIPIMITTALMFLDVLSWGWSPVAVAAWASGIYILWTISYTVGDIPFWGLPSLSTPNPKERVKFISRARLLHVIGGAAPFIMVPILEVFGLDMGVAITAAGIAAAVVGSALFSLAFFGSTERCIPKEKAPTLKECFQAVKINKPLQKVVLSHIIGSFRGLPIVAGMYIAIYLVVEVALLGGSVTLEGSALNPVIAIGWAVAGFVGLLFVPKLYKKIDAKRLYIGSAILGTTASILMFALALIVGIENRVALFAIIIPCLLLCGLPFGVVSNVNYTLIAEAVDYGEYVTGNRVEGMVVSLQTLMNQLSSAIQAGFVALSLVWIRFAQPLVVTDDAGRVVERIVQQQSHFTLWGFMIIISLLPAIGWILSAIPMGFYDFVGKKRKMIYAELDKRRSKAVAKEK